MNTGQFLQEQGKNTPGLQVPESAHEYPLKKKFYPTLKPAVFLLKFFDFK